MLWLRIQNEFRQLLSSYVTGEKKEKTRGNIKYDNERGHKRISNKRANSRRNWSPVEGKGMRIQTLFAYEGAHPPLVKMNTAPLRAVVVAHAAAGVTRTPEGATPAVAASAPLIGAAAVAPTPLGPAHVLRLNNAASRPSCFPLLLFASKARRFI